jgi:Uri superfamily endonuclease
MERKSIIASFPEKGVYTLIIKVLKEKNIKIGALGWKSFVEGYYAYTGSALGGGSTSLRSRILRHLRKNLKKKRWHIDFLLAAEDVQLRAVTSMSTNQRKECQINKKIKRFLGAKIPVPRFGASDCKQACVSHLLYLGKKAVMRKIKRVYEEEGGGNIYFLILDGSFEG